MNNRRRGQIYGIGSNGQGWQFSRLPQAGDVFESALLEWLRALDFVRATCVCNVP